MEAIVASKNNNDGDQRLVAYIVPKLVNELSINELRLILSQKLPSYMVPTDFMFIDSIPRLPNGKIDRTSLPEPKRKRPLLTQTYIAPRTDLEIYLSKLWCEILQIDKVGLLDPFFELGGTSLQAARIVNSIQCKLEANIYIISIFEAPTVSAYAKYLQIKHTEAVAKKFKNGINFSNDAIYMANKIKKEKECVPNINSSSNKINEMRSKVIKKKKFVEGQRLKRISQRKKSYSP